MDRETVITHLQIIHTWASYAREYNLHFITSKHLEDMVQWADDAITLLKEQEAVEPRNTYSTTPSGKVIPRIFCGKCNKEIYTIYTFCPFCGQAVKWE